MERIIFKLDSKGKTRILKISTDGADLIQESGLIDGKLVIHRSTCGGKNIGRSNETTPEEQAILEAESKFAKKVKGEYFEVLEDMDNMTPLEKVTHIRKIASENIVILPMLAKDYKEPPFPCYAQPKLDGMRSHGKKITMISRENSVINTVPHIQESLKQLPDDLIIDGELYAHGLSFQENMKLIKKVRPETINVKYHVYDLVSDEPFKARYDRLAMLVKDMDHVELVPTYVINNEEDLKRYHALFLSQGYEGTIVRWGDGGYENNKRSKYLLKYKDFLDIALEIIDIRPSDKYPKQGFPIFEWIGAKNDELSAGMKFGHAFREEFLRNKEEYIGQVAELRFFEYSDDGVPRFPVCHGFRLDK